MKVIDHLAEESKKSEPVVNYPAQELKREQQKQQRTGLKAMGRQSGRPRSNQPSPKPHPSCKQAIPRRRPSSRVRLLFYLCTRQKERSR